MYYEYIHTDGYPKVKNCWVILSSNDLIEYRYVFNGYWKYIIDKDLSSDEMIHFAKLFDDVLENDWLVGASGSCFVNKSDAMTFKLLI